MSQENRFLVFAMEQYRVKKGLTGSELAQLFGEHDVYALILDNYFLYHIEAPTHFIQEIDAHINKQQQRA